MELDQKTTQKLQSLNRTLDECFEKCKIKVSYSKEDTSKDSLSVQERISIATQKLDQNCIKK